MVYLSCGKCEFGKSEPSKLYNFTTKFLCLWKTEHNAPCVGLEKPARQPPTNFTCLSSATSTTKTSGSSQGGFSTQDQTVAPYVWL